jgi:hypothetical protein
VRLSICKKQNGKILMRNLLNSSAPQLLIALNSFLLLVCRVAQLSSGGTIIIWQSNRFDGHVIFHNNYVMSVEFQSSLSGAIWVLANVYAPTSEGKTEFLNWLHDYVMPDETDWLLVGDFNLIRRPSDHNRPGGNVHEMFWFNEVICYLRLEELSLQGNRFTWSNKQTSSLLERLDWFFASPGSLATLGRL